MADREKRGEDGNTKIWISWERKKLFKWTKKHLSWFLKGYHLGEKQKFVKKKVDTSFKVSNYFEDFLVLISVVSTDVSMFQYLLLLH